MGRAQMICRLALRDLRQRPVQAVLLLLAIMAAASALTLGIALRDVTSQPYQRTRAATAAPDVVATVFPVHRAPARLSALRRLERGQGVTGHAGPYPVVWTTLRSGGHQAAAMVEGRDRARSAIDQPELVAGGWVRPGGAVIERSFATALGVRPGDRITLSGRSFTVSGIAVSAAIPAYPEACSIGCVLGGRLSAFDPGLIWVTRSAATSLAGPTPPAYFMNLTVADPARAAAFAAARNSANLAAPFLVSWQYIEYQDATASRNDQRVLLTGGWLLATLAIASVTVLVGGRMAEQTRRVGLLKAVGARPGLVAAVLLAEHLALALVAGAAGLVIGWLTAPLLTGTASGLIGAASAAPVTASGIGLVAAVAVAIAAGATLVPAVRAARTSTVRALADAARPPRRIGWLIAVSARLPLSLLLGLRFAARRPRRIVLNIVSVAVTVSGVVAVLVIHAVYDQQLGRSAALPNPETVSLNKVTLILTVILAALAAVNAILITWATALDARRWSALGRAFGATPRQVSAGLSMAQLLPGLAGALLGVPGGIGLFAVANTGGPTVIPPTWWLAAAVLGTMLGLACLTAIPARIGARRPPAAVLQSELA